MNNEQKLTSNEQKLTGNEQQVKSFTSFWKTFRKGNRRF